MAIAVGLPTVIGLCAYFVSAYLHALQRYRHEIGLLQFNEKEVKEKRDHEMAKLRARSARTGPAQQIGSDVSDRVASPPGLEGAP